PLAVESDHPANGIMIFDRNGDGLEEDDDYSLYFVYEEYDWYGGNIFKYYSDYYYENPGTKLEEFAIDSPSEYDIFLVPSQNDFSIKVRDRYNLPLENAKVYLSRKDYDGNDQKIWQYTDSNGIATFNNLEYDYSWVYDVEYDDFYYLQNQPLKYYHTFNYIDSPILTTAQP
ncbi:MAG: hypothetical protein EAX96_21050, partial [Candidatus Lokiarchaeota archaeon]|nr:hypothetical protein [Candidatus Lokiarchaeota archaeon]